MNYADLRKRMIDEQLIPRGITDAKVLKAFREVERHEFVPQEIKDSSYDDNPLPIGEGQTISQPYMVALMTQCLGLKGGETVLEIGTGSGYQAAILGKIAKAVYSVERIKPLAERAKALLVRLGYNNIHISVSDGTMGWEEHAPYGGIIVTAAAPKIPPAYTAQLKMSGRLVIPVGSMYSQVLSVIEKRENGLHEHEVCGCVFVPLIGKDGWERY